MSGTVSVVIPAYNSERFIAGAVESVLGQTYPDVETVVVDDGSTDGTVEALRPYLSHVRLIQKVNGGVATARNAGAAAATGRYVSFLDADDVWLPRKLERQVALLEADPGLGCVHCGMDEVDAEGRLRRRLVVGGSGWIAADMLLLDRPTLVGPGSTLVMPRELFQQLGGFDSQLPPSEDWELGFRIALKHRVGFVPEPLVRYRIHGGNAHLDPRRMERSMLRAWAKAFADAPAPLRRLRRRSYGNLYRVLAGDFLLAGDRWSAIRYAAKSLILTPGNAARIMTYPARRLRRRRRRAPATA